MPTNHQTIRPRVRRAWRALAVAALWAGAAACGNADGSGGGGGHGGSTGGDGDPCGRALDYAISCGDKYAVACRSACEASCVLDESCAGLNGADVEAERRYAACVENCDSDPGPGSGASSPSGAGPSSGAGASSSAGGNHSTGAGNNGGSSSGSGGANLAGCIAYVDNMCKVCHSLCGGQARRDALHDCDTFYPSCQKNLDCQARAATCQAAGACPDC